MKRYGTRLRVEVIVTRGRPRAYRENISNLTFESTAAEMYGSAAVKHTVNSKCNQLLHLPNCQDQYCTIFAVNLI